MLIIACCDIDEMMVYVEFHQGPKPMESVWGYMRHILDGYLQLVVISVEDNILLPLLVHVIRVP
jgi:hypothetical protein